MSDVLTLYVVTRLHMMSHVARHSARVGSTR